MYVFDTPAPQVPSRLSYLADSFQMRRDVPSRRLEPVMHILSRLS
jgi:hypothetical protein